MAISRAYTQRRRAENTARTRAQIMDAVRKLLEEGTFHGASVEEIAQLAGVSRATLYQHFGSRFGLVDAICESFSENPSMTAIQAAPDIAADAGALRDGVSQAQARATLLLLTSFHTFEELRAAGLTLKETERFAVSRTRELLNSRDAEVV